MKVDLIDYTGAGHKFPDQYAGRLLAYTKNTRLTQGAESRDMIQDYSYEKLIEELEYIANTIRSSWEFINYTFEIKGVTRAFTHQFVRTRTASFAQQTMRTITIKDIQVSIPDSIVLGSRAYALWDSAVGKIRHVYDQLIQEGIPPEDARGILPTNIKTNIIAGMNLRTLADLVGKRDNPRAQGEYTHVVKHMSNLARAVHPWTENFLYPDRTSTPELNRLLYLVRNEVISRGMKTIGGYDIPDLKTIYKELDMLKGVWG